MKMIMILVLFVAGTTISCDDDIAPGEVPSVIDNTFKTQFPDAEDVEWERNQEFYEVDFEWKNIDYSALLDEAGDLVKFKYDLPTSKLPQSVKNNFAQNHPKKSIDDAEAVHENEIVYYQIETEGFLQDKKLVFGVNGEETTTIEFWN